MGRSGHLALSSMGTQAVAPGCSLQEERSSSGGMRAQNHHQAAPSSWGVLGADTERPWAVLHPLVFVLF